MHPEPGPPLRHLSEAAMPGMSVVDDPCFPAGPPAVRCGCPSAWRERLPASAVVGRPLVDARYAGRRKSSFGRATERRLCLMQVGSGLRPGPTTMLESVRRTGSRPCVETILFQPERPARREGIQALCQRQWMKNPRETQRENQCDSGSNAEGGKLCRLARQKRSAHGPSLFMGSARAIARSAWRLGRLSLVQGWTRLSSLS